LSPGRKILQENLIILPFRSKQDESRFLHYIPIYWEIAVICVDYQKAFKLKTPETFQTRKLFHLFIIDQTTKGNGG